MKFSDPFPDIQNYPEFSEVADMVDKAVASFKDFTENLGNEDLEPLNENSKKLSFLLKKVALENNIQKAIALDTYLVDLTCRMEDCIATGETRFVNRKNIVDREINSLKVISNSGRYYSDYENYIPVIQSSVPGIAHNFSNGLTFDAILACICSMLKIVTAISSPLILSREYYELSGTRKIVFERIKALYEKQQISHMDHYSKDFPNDPQSTIFLKKRRNLVKKVTDTLEKTAVALSEPDVLPDK